MLDVSVLDEATKRLTHLAQPVLVESRLPAFFRIPADAVTTGNYDVLLHCENTAQSIGLLPTSLLLVTSHQYFEVNLIKSLSIIWMMSILVIIVAVLCSTFLSWPIAIVLTVLLLLGHWGVDQLADVSGPGLGRQVALAAAHQGADVVLAARRRPILEGRQHRRGHSFQCAELCLGCIAGYFQIRRHRRYRARCEHSRRQAP